MEVVADSPMIQRRNVIARHRDKRLASTGKSLALVHTEIVDSTRCDEEIVKSDFQEIASYDWVAASVPTIGIPGNPKKLTPAEMPLIIQPDFIAFARTSETETTMDPYTFRLEALVQACMRTSPRMSFKGVDIICGVNNLRKIFDFARGKQKDPFRIDVEICSEVLMMTRWDEDSKNLAQTSLCRGYGRGFEEACTTQEEQDVKSTSHHRIFSYSLGGLSLLVQSEVDACDCRCFAQDSWEFRIRSSLPRVCPAVSAKATLPQTDLPHQMHLPDSSTLPLAVVDVGMKHSSECLVEIKSRDKKNTRMDDIMVQMWFSGLHRLYLGRHLRGTFVSTHAYQKDVTSDLAMWQRQNENEIAIFVGLLKHVKQTHDEMLGVQI
ncbi:hypothetical protein Q7P37_009795 [Cladosporium fusiforme]